MQGLVRGGRQRSPVHGVGILTVILGATIASLWGTPAEAQELTPVYTEEQATAGRTLYAETCARCHGADLSDGSAPPLAGPTFRRTWSRPNVNVADLLYVMETTMPPRRVGQLSQEESVSILAYIMSQNGLRAGSAPLVADPVRLAAISLLSEQDALAGTADAFIQGERSHPVGTGPTA